MNRITEYDNLDETFRAGMPQHGPVLPYPDYGRRRKPKWWPWFIGFIVGFLTARAAFPSDPASEARAALTHAKSLPPQVAAGARFLSLYGIEDGTERREAAKVLSKTINDLSRSRTIYAPKFLTDSLAVIYLPQYAQKDYASFASTWDRLAEKDYHFYLRTEVLSTTAQAGKIISAAKTKQIGTVGGWTGLPVMAELQAWTQSKYPICDARHFVFNGLDPAFYHDFAGVPPKEEDFVKSLGLQPAVIEDLRANAGANLIQSQVTFKPRRVIWSQGPIGGVYSTLDVIQVDAERDPIRRPVSASGLNLKFDVSEWFALAPNAMWRTALYDAAGKRQDTVPDKVAKDKSGDGIVYNARSCFTCHVEDGLRPFSDDQSKILANGEIQSYDPHVTERAKEFYNEPRLQRQMAFDRESHAAAVKEATGGMTPAECSAALDRVLNHYAYQPLSVDQAAWECGVDAREFKAANRIANDPYIISLLNDQTILRDQWGSSFQAAILACAVRRGK